MGASPNHYRQLIVPLIPTKVGTQGGLVPVPELLGPGLRRDERMMGNVGCIENAPSHTC